MPVALVLATTEAERRPVTSVYIEIWKQKSWKGGSAFMSDYEVLSLVLMILGIITSLLISLINHTKK